MILLNVTFMMELKGMTLDHDFYVVVQYNIFMLCYFIIFCFKLVLSF